MKRYYNHHQLKIALLCIVLFCVGTIILKFLTMDNTTAGHVLRLSDEDRSSNKFADEYNTNTLKYSDTDKMLVIDNNYSFNGERIVHLDLKGAPPLISYFEELFPVLMSLRVSSLLVEYEDMFPYDDEFITAKNSYAKRDIKKLLRIAEKNKLHVIPLVQTFGHLEFVLKSSNYKHLREIIKYPQSICPSQNETFTVLTRMLDNVMSLHPNSRYIHIGCDEVYHLGMCEVCTKVMMDNNWSIKDLFLNHVSVIARYVRTRYPQVTPLIWDDELHTISPSEMRKFDFHNLVEPVVWSYKPVIDKPEEVWEKLSSVFASVWVASSFKGATGPNQILPNIRYHLENNFAWLQLIKKYSGAIKFNGIVLTGWQRYDHFAVLCELLPVSIPSLVSNLLLLAGNGSFNNIVAPKIIEDIVVCGTDYKFSYQCNFPGARLYNTILDFYNVKTEVEALFNGSISSGWMTEYNIKFTFSSPTLMEEFSYKLTDCLSKMQPIGQMLWPALAEVYDVHTVNEWMDTVYQPFYDKMEKVNAASEKLLNVTDWPRRPLT